MSIALKPRDKPTLTLDQRIANFLANGVAEASSEEIAKLLHQTKQAAAKSQQAAEAEAERALDPTNLDPEKSRTLAEKLRFEHERLSRAIPLLEQQLRQAQARAYATQWNDEFEQVETERDALAEELTATYPDLVAKLVDLLDRIEACDREVDRVNGSAPSGDHRRRLLGVELTARGLNSFSATNPSLTANLKLPNPGDTRSLAYPPEQVNVMGLQMAAAASALAAKSAGLHTSDWAAARELQIAEEQRKADQRQAEIDRKEAEAKAQYERNLVESDRARRLGRR